MFYEIYWQCKCGYINLVKEKECHRCGICKSERKQCKCGETIDYYCKSLCIECNTLTKYEFYS